MKEYDKIAQKSQDFLGPDWENNLPCSRGVLFYAFGRIALSQGDYARACVYLSRCATIAMPERILGIQAIGNIATARGQAKQAVVIFGALERWFGWVKNVTSPAERAEYEQSLTTLRSALGEDAFSATWAEGQALTLEQTIELAKMIAAEPNA
jgi:hypothetical protein